MADEKRAVKHRIIMEQREHVLITGVIDVISFDEENVIAETELGVVALRGTDLHVNNLNLDSGELDVDGAIDTISYEDQTLKGKSSFLGKIFK